MNAALLARLIAAGTPADLVAEVAMELARASAEQEALQRLRAAATARKQEQRRRERDGDNTASRDVARRDATGGDDRDNRAASPPDKKVPPNPLKELTPPTPTVEADASTVPPAGADVDRGSAGEEKRGEADDADQGDQGRAGRKRKTRKRAVGSRISPDWTAPPIAELPLEIQAIVQHWPAGAYDMVAFTFRNHWLSEGRAIAAKRSWPRTWHNWLYRENVTVLRAKKQGVVFLTASGAVSPDQAARLRRELQAFEAVQADEAAAVRAVRAELREQCGQQTYDGWLRPTFIDVQGRAVTVSASSQFMLDWIQQNFADRLQALFARQLGGAVDLRWGLLRECRANAAA